MKFYAVLAVVSLSTLAVAGSNNTIPYINQLYAIQAVFDYNFNQTGSLTGFGYLSYEKIPKQNRGSFSSATETALNQLPAAWPEMESLGSDAYLGYNTNDMTADPRKALPAFISSVRKCFLSREICYRSKLTPFLPFYSPSIFVTQTTIEAWEC